MYLWQKFCGCFISIKSVCFLPTAGFPFSSGPVFSPPSFVQRPPLHAPSPMETLSVEQSRTPEGYAARSSAVGFFEERSPVSPTTPSLAVDVNIVFTHDTGHPVLLMLEAGPFFLVGHARGHALPQDFVVTLRTTDGICICVSPPG